MKTLNILILFFFLIVWGCTKDDNPINDNGLSVSSIMPLKVGNSWTFLDSLFNENGTFNRVDTSQLKITGKTIISYQDKDIEVYYWDWIDLKNGQPSEIILLCGNDSNGFNIYGGKYLDSIIVLGKFLFLKYPAEVGEEWDYISIYYQSDRLFTIGDTSKITCISVNEKLKTAKGTISCYTYTNRRTYLTRIEDIYLYYAENIGYVGYITKINGTVVYKKILLSNNL